MPTKLYFGVLALSKKLTKKTLKARNHFKRQTTDKHDLYITLLVDKICVVTQKCFYW